MDDGDLHWGNTELVVTTAMRYGLELPQTAVPRQHCPCGWHGMDPAGWETRAAREITGCAQRSWARHVVQSCQKAQGVRTQVHDSICDVLVAMLENAGFLRVKKEDADWDAAAGYGDADHRRPDVTCLHPVTRVKWVLDVVTFWGESAGMGEGGWAKMATRREEWKERRYSPLPAAVPDPAAAPR
eukprot:SAG11_NODE_390_length_9860_cov_49.246184_3_plen_185_part_00